MKKLFSPIFPCNLEKKVSMEEIFSFERDIEVECTFLNYGFCLFIKGKN